MGPLTDAGIGAALALATILCARLVGFDRDRACYPLLLIAIALLYVLFAAQGDARAAWVETPVALAFAVLAVLSYRTSTGWLVAAYLLHAGWDVTHDVWVSNAGVPAWWPGLCVGYDVVIALYLGRSMRRGDRTELAGEQGCSRETPRPVRM
jgi:hypothetical protein